MDDTEKAPGSSPSSNEPNPRVKFLCSFSGSILPRPHDGKLRYVGGETRIVTMPRDISYEDLMGKMREIFEGVAVLKYQQPDEELDALVSVVNDDDVTNMMEEYDKLGPDNGFTRLRLFLFANTEPDGSLQFGDGDERDHERRYVDALNSLNESPKSAGLFDDVNVAEQYFNQMNLEGGFHVPRSMELPMAQMNLRHLTIPRMASQQPVTPRYNETEAPWSPAYYSPRQQPVNVEQRTFAEFPASPSSSRYCTPYSDFSDKGFDRMPEDYIRPPTSARSMYQQQPLYTDNVVLYPTGPLVNEKSGFPGNILQGSGIHDGNSVCEHCRMAIHRNQVYPDYSWRPGEPPPLEPPHVVSGYLQVPTCAELPPNREIYSLNSETNMHHSLYPGEQNDPRSMYTVSHNHDREWVSPHQSYHWTEELRPHVSVAGRIADNYIVEGRGVHHGNPSYTYGPDFLYQVPHGHIPSQAQWRNVHSPVQGGPSYEPSASAPLMNSSVGNGFLRGTVESTPLMRAVLESQNSWAESSHRIVGVDRSVMPEHPHGQAVKSATNSCMLENHHPHTLEPIESAAESSNSETSKNPSMKSGPASFADITFVASGVNSRNDNDGNIIVGVNENSVYEGRREANHGVETENFIARGVIEKNSDAVASSLSINLDISEPVVKNGDAVKLVETNASTFEEPLDEKLEFLPELIESVKEAAVQGLNEVKAKIQEAKEDAQDDTNGVEDLEVDYDYDNSNNSKIEQTKAEVEAIDQGLQTIKNEDLEEIRELGSGTYGAVYHGKWKGSDVAIKRIKASCFAGRPSERERLIADFWKEAQILSSLHHPNVVSFYGVVRDGPDGSLATVTEFMVNGSLKQFLQKKDRTIDRRKRLIIAMDTAFGMEYLHGKNIVHFDLKCENLLVNMRDPHRPVCKIGDLGLSKVRQQTLVSGGVRGTLPWMAPELLSGKSNMVTEKIDVYSFGVVMWELLTGDEPYADMHCASIIGGIVNNTLRPQIPTWCDPEWKALMESCWAADPSQRPSFSEISQKLRNMAAAMNLK